MPDLQPIVRPNASWQVCRLGELVTLLRRGTAPVYVDDSDVRAIGQRCVTDADFDASRARPHSSRVMAKTLRPEIGDVLINSTGTGTIGRSVVFKDDAGSYIVDGHVTVARLRQCEIRGRWLNDLLRSPAGQRYLESKCYAGSTNQVELSSAALAGLPIALPPPDYQRRAEELLEAVEAEIRATGRLVAKLRLLHESMLLTSFPHTPDTVASLGSLVSEERPIVYGILMPGEHVSNGVPVVKVKDMKSGRIDRESLLRTSPAIDQEYRRSRLQTGDVLLSIRGTVGRVCLVPSSLNGANITQDSARISVPPKICRYVAHYLTSPSAQRFIESETVGLAVRGINLRDVRRIGIPTASEDEATLIANRLDASQAGIEREGSKLSKLSNVKAGICLLYTSDAADE